MDGYTRYRITEAPFPCVSRDGFIKRIFTKPETGDSIVYIEYNDGKVCTGWRDFSYVWVADETSRDPDDVRDRFWALFS